jgi:hypothetical protein
MLDSVNNISNNNNKSNINLNNIKDDKIRSLFQNYYNVMYNLQQSEKNKKDEIINKTKQNIKKYKIYLNFNKPFFNNLSNNTNFNISLYKILSNVLKSIYTIGKGRLNQYEFFYICKLYNDLENTNNDVKLIYYINYLINKYSNILDNSNEINYKLECNELSNDMIEFLNPYKNYKKLMKIIQTKYNKYLLFELTKNITLYSRIRNYLQSNNNYSIFEINIEDIIKIFNKSKLGDVMEDIYAEFDFNITTEQKIYIDNLINKAKIKQFNLREDTYISHNILDDNNDNDSDNESLDDNESIIENEFDENVDYKKTFIKNNKYKNIHNNDDSEYDNENYDSYDEDNEIAQEIMNT